MKIVVKAAELSKPITVWIPLGLAKSEYLWNLAIKHTDLRNRKYLIACRDLIPLCSDILRQVARENGGHFDLVEVERADGTKVTIQV